MEELKIVFLTQDIKITAGGGRFSSDLINGIRKRGHCVNVLIGFSIIKFFKNIKFFKDCDIIHAIDGYPYGIIAAIINIFVRKKLIITVIGTYSVAPLYNKKISCIMLWAYKKADKIVAISEHTRKEILKATISNNWLNKISVINPGIDFQKYYKQHQDDKEEFILSVGGLKIRKGYHISIPAFALAKKKHPNLKYKIVGQRYESDYYYNKLIELIRQYEIEDSVEFLSGISDDQLYDLYKKAEIFILTSINDQYHFEGFGLVFLEAACCGLPVIGTLGNGIEDAISSNGILVDQGNIVQTSKAILNILNDKKMWNIMSANSYDWAKKHDLDMVIDNYLSVYKYFDKKT